MGAALLLGNLRAGAAGTRRPGDRARRSAAIVVYNGPDTGRRRARLHPGAVRARLARRLRAAGARRADRGRRGARDPGRAGAGGGGPGRGGRGARADRAGAARRRRPRRERDGAPGRRGAAPDAARPTPRTATRCSNVEQAGRTALAEMRRLLNAMRHEGDELELLPHPGLDDLDALVDDVRAAGLAVRGTTSTASRSPLPPGLDLSAYRILQEGLTNTLKHAQRRARRGRRALRRRRPPARGARRRPRQPADRNGGPATASSASASGSRSTAGR